MKNLKPQIIVHVLFMMLLWAAFKENDLRAGANGGRLAAVVDSLHYIGHATFKIKTAEGKIIYIDPFQPGDYADSADVVLITHQHSDHNRLNLIRQRPSCTVISNVQAIQNNTYQRFTIGNLKIEDVADYKDNNQKSACVL